MYYIYLDSEFDAVKINNKYHQMLISLGAVMVDVQGNEIDTYYTLIRPYGFTRLTRVVKKITQINDAMIVNAQKLDIVIQEFKHWVQRYVKDFEQICIYSYGPDDRRTLEQNCVSLKIDDEGMLSKMVDLQRLLSSNVCFQGTSISTTLSLDDVKMVYKIEGIVDHNALNDARDLMHIHQAYQRGISLDEEKVYEIMERKKKKALEVQEKQQQRLSKSMKERFKKYKKHSVHLIFEPEVVEQLRLWEERSINSCLHWKTDALEFNGRLYAYEQLMSDLCIDVEKSIPCVTLSFTYGKEVFEIHFLLKYRNATMIENIMIRLQEVS